MTLRGERGDAEPFRFAVRGEGVAERLVELHGGLVVAVDLQSHPLRTAADGHAVQVLHELSSNPTPSVLGVDRNPKAWHFKSFCPAAEHAVGHDAATTNVLCHVILVSIGEYGMAAGVVLGQGEGRLARERVRVEKAVVVVFAERGKQRSQLTRVGWGEPAGLQRSVVAGGDEHDCRELSR